MTSIAEKNGGLPVGAARMAYLLAPYRVKVHNTAGNIAIIGRNSIGLLRLIDLYPDLERVGQVVLRVGSFCEAAGESRILAGGEHHNEQVMNNALSFLPKLLDRISDHARHQVYPRSKGPGEIGGNVVISTNVTILSGVRIGSGAVIGAGAVVTRDVPPFAVAAGNPARVLRYRFPPSVAMKLLEIRWWDFDLDYLAANIGVLAEAAADEVVVKLGDARRNRYDLTEDYIVLEKRGTLGIVDSSTHENYRLAGVEVGGHFVALDRLPDPMRHYLMQLDGNGPVRSEYDLFRHLRSEPARAGQIAASQPR